MSAAMDLRSARIDLWRTPAWLSLPDADDGIRAALPAAELPAGRRLLSARRLDAAVGPWTADDVATDDRPFGVLVLDGALLEDTTVGGRANTQLFSAGSLLRPWNCGSSELPSATAWTVLCPATLAVLDGRFLAATRRWPDLLAVVHERLSDQCAAVARRAALCALPRVEDRVLGLLWELADPWGVVRPDGIAIRLPLTHELIGRMIGAKRPTVSLALAKLADQQMVHRPTTDTWTVSHASRAVLA
jgi:CRP/FNR family cyclic AMP-dependent transcriptional regulator